MITEIGLADELANHSGGRVLVVSFRCLVNLKFEIEKKET